MTFLTKPVDDIALITRVKNLSRLKTLTDEMLMRASTSEQMGIGCGRSWEAMHSAGPGRKQCFWWKTMTRSAERIMETLCREQQRVAACRGTRSRPS